MLRKLAGQVRPPLVILVVGAGVLVSGCAIGFRVPASDITATSATLNGAVGSTRSEQGEWWFEYGKTTALGTETPKRSIQFTELTRHDITEPVTGLEPSTTYHLVLCADDQEPGVGEFCSAQQTFRTFADATADSIVATGDAGPLANMDIDVSSGPGGENPTGHLAADTEFGRLVASAITCVSVTGTTAAISGALEPNSSGSGGFRVSVTDEGPAGSGLDLVGAQLAGTPPADCSPFGGSTLFDGDAVVIDAGASSPAAR